MSETIDAREHINNLINALANLAPSRNLISQFILMVPKDLPVVECSYPEMVSSNEAKALLARSFGIEFGEPMKRAEGRFAVALYTQIHKLFWWLADEEVRSSLAKLSNTPVSSIPNPYAEWLKMVLKKLVSRPNGSKILDFLKMLLQSDKYLLKEQRDWESFLDEAKKRLNVAPPEFEEILRVTIGTLRGAEKLGQERIDATYGSLYIEEWLMHSEYHLDLIRYKRETFYGVYSSRDKRLYELSRDGKRLLEEILMGESP